MMNINMMITAIPDTNNYHNIYGITFVLSRVDPVLIQFGLSNGEGGAFATVISPLNFLPYNYVQLHPLLPPL